MSVATAPQQNNVVHVNAQDGNVSSTNADKKKAKVTPSVTINFNVSTNYDKLVALAAETMDENGVVYTVGRLAKERLFAALALSLDGEVQRVAKPTEPIPPIVLNLLGEARALLLTKLDRAKLDKMIATTAGEFMMGDTEAFARLKAKLATGPIS